jgi:hypothetical protein
MKLNTSVTKSLLMAASIGMVVPLAAQTAATPAKPVEPAKKEVAEKIKIEGVELMRKDGTFLGLTLSGPRFVLSFYDAERKPMGLNVARAVARWNPVNKTGDERSVLNPDDAGKTLVSFPNVRPPFAFKVTIVLLDDKGDSIESFIVDTRPLAGEKTE